LSSRPSAFGERDVGMLEVLADRILKNLGQASQPAAPRVPVMEDPPSSSDEAAGLHSPGLGQAENVRRWSDVVTWALALIVLACAGWLGQRVVHRFTWQKATLQRVPARVNSSATVNSSGNASIGDSSAVGSRTSSTSPVLSKPAARDRSDAPRSPQPARARAPEGSLRIYENGREVYRMPPSSGEGEGAPAAGVVQASSVQPEKVLELSASAAESGLTHRVEPEYPEEARLQGIQGAVVLEVHIRADGSVEQLKVLSGEAVLADAAMTAVRQWRFKPRQVNGQPAEMQTTITLNFRLPS
jgi:TonB family protein